MSTPLNKRLPFVEQLESRMLLASDVAGVYSAQANLVTDLNPERVRDEHSIVADVEFNGQTYFVHNSTLWKTDQTPEGTVKLANVHGLASKLHATKDRIYYAIDTDPVDPRSCGCHTGAVEIWSTNGSPHGQRHEAVVTASALQLGFSIRSVLSLIHI